MVIDDLKIAEIFNDYFANITQDLGITETGAYLLPAIGIEDPVNKALEKYKTTLALRRLRSVLHTQNHLILRK